MTFASPKRLLFLAALVMVFVLALAPASFAGEDDPGPTQAGETLGVTTTGNGNSGSSSQSSNAKKLAKNAKKLAKKDTVHAKGGIQTGFGGMTASGPNMLFVLALAGGGLAALAGPARIAPVGGRMDH